MSAVLLALGAALAYGIGDFTGGFGSRRTSAWSVAFAAQVVGSLAVLVVALALGGSPGRDDLAWGVLGGLFNGVGTAFLYRGLSTARIGVVAPLAGVASATVPVLVGVLIGERPAPLVWLGIAVALPAILLVSHSPEPAPASGEIRRSGVLDGLLAGAGFGGLFVCLAHISPEAGLYPLALNQIVAGAAIVLIAAALRAPWVPRHRATAYGALAGLLGGTATALFQTATQTGYLTVSAVITSLYPGVTIVLAAALLRERIHRPQALGLVLCAACVALVALANR